MLLATVLLLINLLHVVTCDDFAVAALALSPNQATMNLTYQDPVTNQLHTESEDIGRYGSLSRKVFIQ